MNPVGQEVELSAGEEGSGTALARVDAGSLAILNRSEIEQQVSTAKMYPRSIKAFRAEAMDMVTLTEKIAEECIYAVPRGGKTIEGPSARFAEIIISAWGNVRAGARIISEDPETVTAQGFFFDVERNVTIALEIKRRITDKQGRRYNTDMIATTGNAAASIAFRNSVLKGIPKAFWTDMYDAARKTAVGTVQTLVNKRAEMILYFQKMGITADIICATLEVPGVEDIGLDELAKLKGMATALKEGESTPEQLFMMPEKPEKSSSKGSAGLKEKLASKKEPEKKAEPVKAESEKKPEPEKKLADTGGPSGGLNFGSPPPKESPPGEPFQDPAKTVGQVLHDEAQDLLKKDVEGAQAPVKEDPEHSLVLAVAEVLRKSKSKNELDQAWKREVESGTLSKVSKKKLMFVYQEVFERINKE